MRAPALIVLGLAAAVSFAAPAHAYLDPVTGSVILQMVLGAVAGVLVGVKVYWIKIKAFFRRAAAKNSGAGKGFR